MTKNKLYGRKMRKMTKKRLIKKEEVKERRGKNIESGYAYDQKINNMV